MELTVLITFFPHQKLGDIDTSSGKNMLLGLRNKEAPAPVTAPVPSQLPSSKPRPLAPPPRHGTIARARTPTPEPEPEPEPEEVEYEGEWAEALYDYKSTVHFFMTFSIPCEGS